VIRLGLPLIGRGQWTGGLTYLLNMLRLIETRLAGEVQAVVLLSPQEAAKHGAALAAAGPSARILVEPALDGFGRGASLTKALLLGRDGLLARSMIREGVDAAFEVATFYGWRFPLPVIAWMPDFQHRHMPWMFSAANWWRRDLGFQAQIAAGRTIMLSSETARTDCERFYPSARGRTQIVRFAVPMDVGAVAARSAQARAAHGVPERFFFLPNQFWKHKNHTIVVDALARLKGEGVLDALPPVILSGLQTDPRDAGHFPAVMRRVAEAGLDSHFRHLGLIPYPDVLALAACCDRLINPSLFEGWSTPIEEAKALGAPMILSDIDIHREQAPGADFFPPDDAEALAALMRAAALAPSPDRAPAAVLQAAQEERLAAHAAALLAALEAAVSAQPRR